MNICMVTHDFPPQVGGISAHVFELTRQLIKWNHRVIILTSKLKNFGNDRSEGDDFQVKYVQERFDDKSKSIFLPIKVIDYSIRAHLILKKIIKKYSIDLVHYHNLVPESLVTKRIDVPVIFTAHESHLVKSAQKNRKRLNFYLSHIDHLIAASQDRLEIVRKFCPYAKSAHYISNGVDIERFNFSERKAEIRQEYQVPSKTKIILIVSRLEEVKGVSYFIEAVSQILRSVEDVQVFIVGSGSQASILQNRIHELKINEYVDLKGLIENKYLPDFYALADLVVIPSLEEATSITGLEAMASGKPIIGTKVGGIPDLIDDGENGILVPPKNPKELANAVITMFKDSNRMIEMGKYSRKKAVEQFSWEKITKETLKIYERCYSS